MPLRRLRYEASVIAWTRIEGFIGFGRGDAPVVFIGMEEGLKNAAALDEDLAIRSSYMSNVMDLKEAHRGIAGTERYFDPDRAPRQPTWRVMADLMLRRVGCPAQPGPIADDTAPRGSVGPTVKRCSRSCCPILTRNRRIGSMQGSGGS
jgi:hypothetical protein